MTNSEKKEQKKIATSKKINKTWQAILKYQGSIKVIEPNLFVIMRYLLDTNIFVYSIADRDNLCNDVLSILENYDNTFYMSSESVKELIVAFRNKKLLTKVWKTPYEMVRAITEDFYVTVLPVDNEVMKT